MAQDKSDETGKIVIQLEDKPESGQMPVSHVVKIQDASKEKPKPKATPIVRQALQAWADNLALVHQARRLKVTSDLSFAGLVKFSLTQAIRVQQLRKKGGK